MNPNNTLSIQGVQGSNPLSFLSQGGQIPIQGPPNPSEQSQNDPFNSAVQFVVPAAGGILGGILGGAAMPFGGEIAGGAAGMAGGQALADILTGKKPGLDVPITGAFGLAGGALGGILGKVGSKLAAGAGEDLATGGLNLTKGQLAKYAANFNEPLSTTLTSNGLAGVNVDALDTGISKLQEIYNTLGKSDVKVGQDTFLGNATKVIDGLSSQAPQSSKDMASAIQDELQNNVLPKLNQDSTMADYQTLKSQYDKYTNPSQFDKNPGQWNVNRAVGDILRKTINDAADTNGIVTENGLPLSQLGTTIMKLRNVQDLAAGRAGVGGSPFTVTNLLLGGEGGLLAHAVGANPLAGILLPGSRIAYGAARSNPMIAGLLSKGATATAEGLSKATPALSLAGVLGGGALSPMVNGANESQQNEQSSNQQSNQNIPSFPQQSVSQNGQNVNTTGQAEGQNSVNTSFGTFPRQLPAPTDIANTVPGQPYPISQYQADVAKWTALAAANPYNPGVQTQAQLMINEADKNKAVNDQWVQQYIQQQGLPADAQDFIRTAQPQWNNLVELRDLLQTKGAQNLFQSFIQADPTMQSILAAKDPKYALMFNLLGQQKLAQARLAQGGVPRAYDLALSKLGTGQTAQANLAILDYAMSQFQSQYEQYAPAYGLSLGSIPNTTSAPTLTGNKQLDTILSGGL